jgi:hypothetical protein
LLDIIDVENWGLTGDCCKTSYRTALILEMEHDEKRALFGLSPEVAELNMIKFPSGKPG